MRSEAKVAFFSQKLSDLGPVLNKLMQLKHVTDGHSHSIRSGAWGHSPCRCAIFVILQQKNSNFKAILITLRTF